MRPKYNTTNDFKNKKPRNPDRKNGVNNLIETGKAINNF